MLRIATDVRLPVRLEGISPEMVLGAIIVAGVFDYFEQDAYITSCSDGQHKTGSRHHCGKALDFRTRIFELRELPALVSHVESMLGPEFFVLLEATHLHVEYDPK